MAALTCIDCGASNPKEAVKCKKCSSPNLRLKNPAVAPPLPSISGLCPEELSKSDEESTPSDELSDEIASGKDDVGREEYDFFAPLPSACAFHVEIVAGTGMGKGADIKEGVPVLMGASPSSDLDLSSDPYASKRHASLTLKDGRILLADEGSTNGTYLRVSDHWQIEDGAEILIGKTLLRVMRKA